MNHPSEEAAFSHSQGHTEPVTRAGRNVRFDRNLPFPKGLRTGKTYPRRP
jgi:hypothetical protein